MKPRFYFDARGWREGVFVLTPSVIVFTRSAAVCTCVTISWLTCTLTISWGQGA